MCVCCVCVCCACVAALPPVSLHGTSPPLRVPPHPPTHPPEVTSTGSNVLKYVILGAVCLLSFAIRLFAVVRWESVIHEFDPCAWVGRGGGVLGLSTSTTRPAPSPIHPTHPPPFPSGFNFRTTKFLTAEGFYEFLNWCVPAPGVCPLLSLVPRGAQPHPPPPHPPRQDDRSWHPLGRLVGGTVYPGLMVTARVLHWLLNAINISINVRCVRGRPVPAPSSPPRPPAPLQ